jgi:hypothetical protein
MFRSWGMTGTSPGSGHELFELCKGLSSFSPGKCSNIRGEDLTQRKG